jgi:hypothetical protein
MQLCLITELIVKQYKRKKKLFVCNYLREYKVNLINKATWYQRVLYVSGHWKPAESMQLTNFQFCTTWRSPCKKWLRLLKLRECQGIRNNDTTSGKLQNKCTMCFDNGSFDLFSILPDTLLGMFVTPAFYIPNRKEIEHLLYTFFLVTYLFIGVVYN